MKLWDHLKLQTELLKLYLDVSFTDLHQSD